MIMIININIIIEEQKNSLYPKKIVLLKEKANFIIWSIFGNWAGFF